MTGHSARLERSASAGPTGEDVRSDVFVEIQPSGGGIELEIESRVGLLYGDRIESDLRATLESVGVGEARVRVEDRGALPFVLCARLEAAAVRAGAFVAGTAHPARLRHWPASPRDRQRRSRLYLPGNQPKFMINAGLHGPDGVILDLEDSVHPDEKDAARLLVRNALGAVDFGPAERMVRINQGEIGDEDLRVVVPAGPDLLLLPKVESPDEVIGVARRIDEIQSEAGVDRPLWLMPILESARGIERATEIAAAHERVVALTLGLEDYTADLGVPKTDSGEESRYARERVVVAARAAGVQPIDSVYGNVGDMTGLLAWASRSRAMGYVGMGCVHPRQIRVLHEAFAPSAEEVEKACRIVEAFERAQAAGESVVSLGSRMIDPPVVKRALAIVAQAQPSREDADDD